MCKAQEVLRGLGKVGVNAPCTPDAFGKPMCYHVRTPLFAYLTGTMKLHQDVNRENARSTATTRSSNV